MTEFALWYIGGFLIGVIIYTLLKGSDKEWVKNTIVHIVKFVELVAI